MTIGNDGKRVGISINDSTTTIKNSSVPANVLNALFQFSDKYPVKVKVRITQNTSGKSLPDPILNQVTETNATTNYFGSNNPVANSINLFFADIMVGSQAKMELYDITGRLMGGESFTVSDFSATRNVDLPPGVYILSLEVNGRSYRSRILKK